MNPKGSKTKVGQDKSEVVAAIPLACADERTAVEFFEDQRWGSFPRCPHCDTLNVYQMEDSKTGDRQANCRWRCRECKKQYTVRTGTVMEDSRIPLRHWAYAFWSAASSKKGVSALQIKRQTGLSYKSALFLMHRIRFAMAPTGGGEKLDGIVEVDETYVGGKPRHRVPHAPVPRNPNNPVSNHQTRKKRHTPVFAAVQRSGAARVRVLPDVTAATLKSAVNQHVDYAARLMSDENPSYKKIGKEYASHDTIEHKHYIYARGDVTTNTVEGFFSLLKRGIYGVYHNVSRKHLQRYLDEFEFRYNHRMIDDGARTVAAIKGSEGKRLMYREPVAQV